jgi:hypothetical protein
MKVAQLRSLCKTRGLESEGLSCPNNISRLYLGRKEDLIAELIRNDEMIALASSQDSNPRSQPGGMNSIEASLTPDELKELATIVDEMKHLRRQWLLQVPRQAQGGQFVHQSYGSSNSRK